MMFLLDANLSPRLVKLLKNHYPGITHVGLHDLLMASDAAIWEFAAAHKAVVITRDKDFLKMSETLPAPPRILHLRLHDMKVAEVSKMLIDKSGEIVAWSDRSDNPAIELLTDGSLKPYKAGTSGRKRHKRHPNHPQTPPSPGG